MTEELRFDGKVAVITGAGRGLGRAYALMLGARGAMVVVNNRSPEAAHDTAESINAAGGMAVACAGDVGASGVGAAVIAAALESFGRIDILVNNAGGSEGSTGTITTISDADRDAVLRGNIIGSWEPTAAAWPHLLAQGSGRVVMTGSPVAVFGAPGLAHYGAAKGAVMGLTKCLAADGAAHGITVNAVHPSAFTDAMQQSVPPEQHAWLERFMSPSSVAASLVWLVHDSCTLNGENILAVGSWFSRLFLGEPRGYLADRASFTPEAIREHADVATSFDDYVANSDLGAYVVRSRMLLESTADEG